MQEENNEIAQAPAEESIETNHVAASLELTPQMQENMVKEFLQKNPHFFEQHAGLLADIYLPSPHGSGTISLAERQQLAQRDKIRVLESKFAELIEIGRENDVISTKVHRLCLSLLASDQLSILIDMLFHCLKEEFHIPYASLKLWATAKNPTDAQLSVFQNVTPTLTEWAQNLKEPYCGQHPAEDVQQLFDAGLSVNSYAVIPIRTLTTYGVMVLGSDDERRFYPEMGNLFISRIGEMVSAAIMRYTIQP